MAEKESPEKGFKVTDRRGQERPKEVPQAESPSEVSPPTPPPVEVNFSSLILSLSTSALFQLGILEDPQTKERYQDLAIAKQTIDLIGLLEQKTRGNLTPDEKQLMESVLCDLRMKFIEETRRKP